MERRTKNSWLIKLALTIAGRKLQKTLKKESKNCQKAQTRVLSDILRYAENTEYGLAKNFSSIHSIAEYQKNVPINEYDDLQPYILRHTKGEQNLLFPGKPIMYATTSGTTKEPKWIPITEKYYRECYNGLSKLWFYSLLKEHPTVFDGVEMSIVGKAIEGLTDDNTPYGSFSGHTYTNIPKFLKEVHVIPDLAYSIDDYYSRYYIFLRFTLQYHIRLLITGNPSTLLELHNIVTQRFDELVLDIEKGTLKDDLKISVKERSELMLLLKPFPARAAELRALKKQHGSLLPKHYWPTLQTIVTWKCGNSGLYLERTHGYYPESTTIREFGYIATEARAGIILHSSQVPSIMACHLLFFEFIREEDWGKPDARMYGAWELEKGIDYYVLVTTPSGLYRYNMNDLLRCEGYFNEFPLMRFIQKGAGVTSLTGEKLHEEQFFSAVQSAAQHLSMPASFYIGFADSAQSCYQIFIEFATNHNSHKLAEFANLIDEKMKKYNIEYKSKRESRRLKPLILHPLKENAFECFKHECMSRGFRDGQFKLTHLLQDNHRMEMFKKLIADNAVYTSQ